MESQRIRALNIEIQALKKQVDKVNSMLSHENFQYNLLESQFESLKVRNQQLQSDNLNAEKKIQESLESADNIIKMAEETAKSVKANGYALYTKAQMKFKEIEEKLEIAEKSVIKRHLKELEAVIA